MQKTCEKFIQFGTGGFLRGFADWMLQKLQDNTDFRGSVVAVQSTPNGLCEAINAQKDGYTHIIRDENGSEETRVQVISRCINAPADPEGFLQLAEIPTMRYVLSNTTEAGIVFDGQPLPETGLPESFPGKVTLLLKRRYDAALPGFVFLPCELIRRNGEALRTCVLQYAQLWQLGDGFKSWVERENVFCCTLVDRINTGFPAGEGYEDPLTNASERYHLWVIETELALEQELPFGKAGLNVIVTRDAMEDYHTRKVRILNGAHTSLVAHGLLSGFETVGQCVADPAMRAYLHKCIFEEILPTLDLPRKELEEYAADVLQRFANPYICHRLAAISLNSVSKFKVRLLPSILAYRDRFGKYPVTLLFALRRLLEFYRTGSPVDEERIIAYIRNHSDKEVLGNTSLWDADLSDLYEDMSHAHP